ncbi:MAG: phage holin family protein [Candidatus Egerieousia sp.]
METLNIIKQDIGHGAAIIFVCCLVVIIAALIDMWTGIEAARKNKEKICSHSLRKTVRKIIDYLRIVIFALLVDILGLFFTWYCLPYCAIVATLGILLIEGRSVIENYQKKKSAAANVVNMMKRIVDCVDNSTAEKIIAAIKDENK